MGLPVVTVILLGLFAGVFLWPVRPRPATTPFPGRHEFVHFPHDADLSPGVTVVLQKRLLDGPGLDSGFDPKAMATWLGARMQGLAAALETVSLESIRRQVAACGDADEAGPVPLEYFVRRMGYSHVIFLAALFEATLEHACEAIGCITGQPVSGFLPEEASVNAWAWRRKFLKRHGRFQVDDAFWEFTETLRTLRNALVHDDGTTFGMDSGQLKRLRATPGLRFDSFEIFVETAFVQEASARLKCLMATIQSEVIACLARTPRAGESHGARRGERRLAAREPVADGLFGLGLNGA